jgi:hypothetical protein
MTRLHVFIKVSSDDAFELKAQALNDDPRLKEAGIAALKFATDKLFVAGGEFLSDLPPQKTTATPSNKKPEVPLSGGRLHVFVRVINRDDSYDLKTKFLNEDPRLQEAGISDIKLVKKQIAIPVPVEHVEQTPAKVKEKPKSRGVLKWGIILGVIGAILAGGFFVIPSLLPTPATPAPQVQEQPAVVVVAPPDTVTPFVAPPITFTSAPVVQDPPTPTDTPIPVVAQTDCSNDFSSDLSNWSYFIVDGGPYYVTDKTFPNDYYGIDQDGWYLFDIRRGNTWVYSTCDLMEYDNVRIDVRVENLGQNDSATMIMCRYTPGVGWYEFDIFNNGEYQIMFTNPTGNFATDYYTIYDGGSNDIKTGQAVNEYTVICEGNTLSLYANGNLVRSAKDDASTLTSGRVGIGEAWSDIAATIRFDWVQVSQQ